MLAIQVDDYLCGGTPHRMHPFEVFRKNNFKVSKLARSNLYLMGCDIIQYDKYSITLSQQKKMIEVDPHVILTAISKGGDGVATLDQTTAYRHMIGNMIFIGQMLFIGHMSAPLMLLHASLEASKLSDLRCHHFSALTTTLTRLKTDITELHFLAPDLTCENPFFVDIISDGAMASAGGTKGRSGHIIFHPLRHIVLPIQWSARKLRRVTRISATAEILFAAQAMANGLYMREGIAELYELPQTELTVDSTSLQSLSTSIKAPEESFIKVDLASIREAFDNHELNAVHWCRDSKMLSDALTKDKRNIAALLLAVLASCKHERPSEMATNFGPPS